MTTWSIELLSDACFASEHPRFVVDVDTCQELDDTGLPRIGGRSLKGLLVEQVALLVAALSEPRWAEAATEAFGRPGDGDGKLWVGDARWDASERAPFHVAVARQPALAALAARATTVVRSQTAIDPRTGSASRGSLRGTRLARRGLRLGARLAWGSGPLADAPADAKALVAAGVRLVRRGGLHRNRGWGRLACTVEHDGRVVDWADPLETFLRGAR